MIVSKGNLLFHNKKLSGSTLNFADKKKTQFFQVDTLPGTNISPLKGTFEDDVFSRWDMLVAWRVRCTLSSFFQASQYRRQSRNPIETRHWVQTSCKAKHFAIF